MNQKLKVTINGKEYQVPPQQTVLDVCRKEGIEIPTMCFLEGLSDVGACRLCLVEIEGSSKLFPACTTRVENNQVIKTETDRLKKYRRMTVELFFAERNHVCSVCVANHHCELQDLGYKVGMEHVRYAYLSQACNLDASHEKFIKDDNRCIMCTRCVRVCDEVEGAHTWDVMFRGFKARIISDFNEPWGNSQTCTSCGKCIEVCPTGALWPKNAFQETFKRNPGFVKTLVDARKNRV